MRVCVCQVCMCVYLCHVVREGEIGGLYFTLVCYISCFFLTHQIFLCICNTDALIWTPRKNITRTHAYIHTHTYTHTLPLFHHPSFPEIKFAALCDTSYSFVYVSKCVVRVLWGVRTLAWPVKCVSEPSEEEEDERVKCVGGDKSSLSCCPCGSAASCLLCCATKITRLWPLTPAEQKHILQRMPYCFNASSHLITWPLWPSIY